MRRAEALRDANARGAPIDVDPAQTEELALAQARHGGGHVDGPFQRAEAVVRHGAREGLELLGLQEADAAVR